jgi:hypothetical protein
MAACADLQPAASGVCGNAVVDADEDCDGHAVSPGAACAPPGDAHECRYVCAAHGQGAAGTTATCPPDFGCGFDGVCRQFTGAFVPASPPAAVSAFSLFPLLIDLGGKPVLFVLGDDLGDGRRFPRVVDPGGPTLGTGIAIPTPMAHPSVIDLDGDGVEDVAFVDYAGIGVVRGQSSEEQAPFFVFPSALFSSKSVEMRAIALRLAPGAHGEDDGDAIVLLEDDGDTLALRRLDVPDPPLLDLTSSQKHVSDLTGDLVHADFDTRAGSPCDQIVVPLRGLAYLTVFSPCTGSDWAAPGTPPIDIALGGSAVGAPTVQGPSVVMDVNSDQRLDIVVDTSAGPYVAFGRGDGTFAPAADLTGTANEAAPLSLSWEDGQDAPAVAPLAGGDLNGDHLTDFVFPTGIALTDATASGSLYWGIPSPGWLEAQIGSGGQGIPFVVATSSSVGLDFEVYSAATRQFAHTAVPTANVTAHLALGDFDGDGTTDVAYTEHSDSLGDTWSVVFGGRAYVPSAPVAMATFDGVLELSPAHLAAPVVGADAITDLVISARIASANTDTLATSLGSSTRQMMAPFQLRGPSGAQALPLAVTAGTFLPSRRSLTALGADDPQGAATLRLWVFPPDGTAAADLLIGAPLSSAFHPSHFKGNTSVDLRYGAHLATGDVDSDGIDEAVLVAPYGPDDTQSALVIVRTANGAIGTTEPIVFGVQSTLFSLLHVGDLDGDGAPDVLFKGLDDTPQPMIVFWNDGSGGFDAGRTTIVNVDGGINDFVCVAGATACTLYVVAPDQTFAVDVGRDRIPHAHALAGVVGGLSITSADFNGDGLGDLAIGAPTELHVFSAVARLP